MKLFNPPIELGGKLISINGLSFKPGDKLEFEESEVDNIIKSYPFLKVLDETYSPDYYDRLNKKSWIRRLLCL